MAYDVAPGLLRPRVGFTQWRNHDAQLWGAVQAEAEDIKSRQLGASSSSSSSSSDASPVILGCDIDEAAVGLAQANVARAGLAGKVRIEKRDVASATKELVGGADHGLLIVNPPYGARLGSHPDAPAPQSSRMSHSNSSSNSGHSSSSSSSSGLEALYKGIGDTMKQQFRGWHGAVFTCNLELAKSVGLRTARRSTFYNGALEGRLLHYKLY
jgi:23S rRNA (guanine2445-N2)-methyltransferase / 23S rRNA (guanine2069-N7)-methyltransferase